MGAGGGPLFLVFFWGGPLLVPAPLAGDEPASGLLGEEVQLVILTSAVRVCSAREEAEGEAERFTLQTRTWLGRAGLPPPPLPSGHRHPLATLQGPPRRSGSGHGGFSPRSLLLFFLVFLFVPPRFAAFVCAGWGMGGGWGNQPLVRGYGLSRYRVPSRWGKGGGKQTPESSRRPSALLLLSCIRSWRLERARRATSCPRG